MFSNFIRQAARTGMRNMSTERAASAAGSKIATIGAATAAAAVIGTGAFVTSADAASQAPDIGKARQMISDIINDLDVAAPSLVVVVFERQQLLPGRVWHLIIIQNHDVLLWFVF